MSRLRFSTVEPVLGTLINFLNMKRVNTRGIKLANKHVLMAALTYNPKKYMKFITKKAVSKAIALLLPNNVQNAFFALFYDCLRLCRLIFAVLSLRVLAAKFSKSKSTIRLKRRFEDGF